MNILFISNDEKILLDKTGGAFKRQNDYAKHFEAMVVILLTTNRNLTKHSINNLSIVPTCSKSKLNFVADAVNIALRQKTKFQLISTQDPFITGLIGLILKIIWQCKLNIQITADYFVNPFFRHESLQNFIFYWLGRFICLFADSFRAPNRDLKLSNRSFIAPFAVDLKFWEAKPHTKIVPKIVTVAARLDPIKRLDNLIAAIEILHRVYPDVQLTIIGEGVNRAILVNQSKSLGISKKIKITGYLTPGEIRTQFRQNSIFALVSESESWGMSAVEALCSGLPVVMTNTGFAKEMMIDNKVGGRIIPRSDPNLIAQAIASLIDNPSKTQHMVITGKTKLNKALSYDLVINNFVRGLKNT